MAVGAMLPFSSDARSMRRREQLIRPGSPTARAATAPLASMRSRAALRSASSPPIQACRLSAWVSLISGLMMLIWPRKWTSRGCDAGAPTSSGVGRSGSGVTSTPSRQVMRNSSAWVGNASSRVTLTASRDCSSRGRSNRLNRPGPSTAYSAADWLSMINSTRSMMLCPSTRRTSAPETRAVCSDSLISSVSAKMRWPSGSRSWMAPEAYARSTRAFDASEPPSESAGGRNQTFSDCAHSAC